MRNKDIFEKRFENLIAFYLIVMNLGKIKSVDYEYLYEKYSKIILDDIPDVNTFNEKLKNDIIIFSKSVKQLVKCDDMISMYENVFGKDSFQNISIYQNHIGQVHALLRKDVFEPYMEHQLHKSRKYKIWKLLNSNLLNP